ncbi:DUF4124 domain-containing protein [Salinisphaera sp. T31B1]|uniref:DUF4124 domain-containing protein n=1 Tax=Salinisphaera sp. T31B1 TaxID=727963 RepID=UPI00334275C7
MTSMKAVIVLVLLCTAMAAHAEIYTWVDAQGVRHYSDSAATRQAKPADLPGLQNVDGDPDALERLRRQEQAISNGLESTPSGAVDSRTPVLVEPQSEATFRDARGLVPVTLTIGGASDLRAGEQITYYLDGSPIPQSPTEQTQLQLGNVARGSHTLSAALLYQGREIRRTPPVTFYMQPPAAISPLNSDAADGDSVPGAATAPAAGNTGGAPAAPRLNNSATGSAPTAM